MKNISPENDFNRFQIILSQYRDILYICLAIETLQISYVSLFHTANYLNLIKTEMKKVTPLNELSIAELYKKKQSIKGALIGLGVVMLAAFVILLYLVFTAKTPKVLAAIPISCALALLPAFISLGQINTEIKNRASK